MKPEALFIRVPFTDISGLSQRQRALCMPDGRVLSIARVRKICSVNENIVYFSARRKCKTLSSLFHLTSIHLTYRLEDDIWNIILKQNEAYTTVLRTE